MIFEFFIVFRLLDGMKFIVFKLFGMVLKFLFIKCVMKCKIVVDKFLDIGVMRF